MPHEGVLHPKYQFVLSEQESVAGLSVERWRMVSLLLLWLSAQVVLVVRF